MQPFSLKLLFYLCNRRSFMEATTFSHSFTAVVRYGLNVFLLGFLARSRKTVRVRVLQQVRTMFGHSVTSSSVRPPCTDPAPARLLLPRSHMVDACRVRTHAYLQPAEPGRTLPAPVQLLSLRLINSRLFL